jgi:hypothetical protein
MLTITRILSKKKQSSDELSVVLRGIFNTVFISLWTGRENKLHIFPSPSQLETRLEGRLRAFLVFVAVGLEHRKYSRSSTWFRIKNR